MTITKNSVIGFGLVAIANLASAATIVDTQPLSYQNTFFSLNEYSHAAIAGTFSGISLDFKAFDVDSATGEVDRVWAKKGSDWVFLGNLVGTDNQNSTTTFSLDSSWNAAVNGGLKVQFLVDSLYNGSYMTPQYSVLTVTTAVPEPETYAMMLAGLGAIGFMARRRQRG